MRNYEGNSTTVTTMDDEDLDIFIVSVKIRHPIKKCSCGKKYLVTKKSKSKCLFCYHKSPYQADVTNLSRKLYNL